LHQLVDLLVIVVVAEHQQNCVDVSRLRQAHYQVPQVDDASVYLWHSWNLASVSGHLHSLMTKPEGKRHLGPTQDTVIQDRSPYKFGKLCRNIKGSNNMQHVNTAP
jgi:hypothetical protein